MHMEDDKNLPDTADVYFAPLTSENSGPIRSITIGPSAIKIWDAEKANAQRIAECTNHKMEPVGEPWQRRTECKACGGYRQLR
ncbi:MAG: hypothetical protein WC869_13545 [Phycisphaerae bacterium]